MICSASRRQRLLRRSAFAGLVLACVGVASRGAEEPKQDAVVGPTPAATSETGTHEAEAPGPGSNEPAKTEPSKPVRPTRAVDEIHGLLNLGVSLTERADYDAAEIAYRQVLNAANVGENELKTALLGLAHMHRRQGALSKAAAIYERFLKDYPGDDRTPDALLDLGRTLRELGVYKLAIARFYAVINSTLKVPAESFDRYQVLAKTAQFEIAETHFQAGEFAEANKFYTRLRLLDLAPSDRARAHFKAGYALRLQGDLAGALTTLKAFIEQWPDSENVPEARYLVATTLRDLNRPQEAFAATLELLKAEKARTSADPKRWAYWQRRTGNQLANDFFEAGDTLNAHAIYAGLLELSTEVTWRLPIIYQLALCYERLGLMDRARSSYQAVLDGARSNPPEDIAELARMAEWRMAHLEWRERVGKQVSVFFDTTTGREPLPSSPAAGSAATPPPKITATP